MIHPVHTITCRVRRIAAEYRARRTYRALCREGRAPRVLVHISLHTDLDDDWSDLRGYTTVAITHHPPLTRRGIRLIASDARAIRQSCIRALLADQETR